MTPPHDILFFLTGGTVLRPTHAAFLAAAAQRIAKTREERRKCDERKGKMREKQMQKDQAFKEVSGMSVGIMRLLGLKRVGERGVVKGQCVEGRQVDKDGEAPNGGGDAKTDAGGTSKEVSPKDAAKEPENETVESDIQYGGYDTGILSHVETRRGGHHGTPLINGDNAGDDGHISIGEIPHMQYGNVRMLPDAEKVTASTPGLLDDKPDGGKAVTIDDRESVASNMIHNSLSQKVQSIHESVHFHVPDTPPVLSVSMGLKVDSGTNPDDTRPPILVSASDPDDDVEDSCDHALNTLQVLPIDTQPRSDSDPKPDDIRPSIVAQAPNPDNFSDPVSRKNTLEELEYDMSSGDIRRSILVTALDPDDSAERISIKDAAPGLESYINPDDTQPPIISLVPDTNDNSNNFYDRLPELSPNNPASIGPQDVEPEVQFRHNGGDPFSPTPHLPPPWETATTPYPCDGNDPFSPTPHLPPPWERHDEMFKAIRSSPPP